MRTFFVPLIVAACLALGPAPGAQQQPSVLQAMQEEMTRAMDGLRMGNEPRPYYIAYAVEDMASTRVLAKLGTAVLVSTMPSRSCTLRVDVRVGDYNVDSSRFQGLSSGDAGSLSRYGQFGVAVPLDHDYDVMKRQIWLATDVAYKRAVQALSKKKATAQNRAPDPDPIPDFSRETPVQTLLPLRPAAPGAQTLTEDLRRISAAFLAYPDIDSSEVSLTESQGARYFLSTEGFKVVEPIGLATLRVVADTQAADGMTVRDFFTVSGKSVKDLPPLADSLARTKELAAGLVALRSAPIGEDFTGPVLVEGQAAPALLAQTFVPLVLSQRAPEIDGMPPGAASRFPVSPFLTRIGARVMPEGFTVRDTPSVDRVGAASLAASYPIDDDGVPGKDVTLVQDGKLLALLTGRVPQKGLLQSNGHSRGGGAQASVVQVESARAIAGAEMKAKYLETLKAQGRAFGYIVHAIADPLEMQATGDPLDTMMAASMMSGASGASRVGPPIIRAVKVTADGTEQLVRGVTFANIQHTSYRNIAEASREREVYTSRAMPSMMGLGVLSALSGRAPMISMVVPSLLFEELEIQRVKEGQLKPPVVASPMKK